jgi:hypothetical protein
LAVFGTQCFPGFGSTFYLATGLQSVASFNVNTGADAGAMTIASELAAVYGGAADASGDILIVGQDPDATGDGIAELWNSRGSCTAAITGGYCSSIAVDCPSATCTCTGHAPQLVGQPLGQAAWLPDGAFVATYYNGDFASSGSPLNTIVAFDPAQGLAITPYAAGAAPGVLTFAGLSQPPP